MLIGLLVAWLPTVCRAEEPPSFAKQVRPFLSRYCLECHNSRREEAGLNMESYKSLLEGSAKGAVLVPGKANDSKMVVQVEGKSKPTMPPMRACDELVGRPKYHVSTFQPHAAINVAAMR